MKKIYLLFLLFFANHMIGQEYKIEKITKSDFLEKTYSLDPVAPAVVEYEIGNTFFDVRGTKIVVITTVKKRIKILSKDGFDYATVQIPVYQDQSTRESVVISNAFTYNLENDEIKKTKLNSSGKFQDKQTRNRSIFTFTMPDVKVGSIIEFNIKITSDFFTYIPDWNFQYKIPVKYSEYSLKIPEELIFYKYIRGNQKINERVLIDTYVYKATNIPALVDENYITNIDNYRSTLMHTFSGYKNKNGLIEKIGGSWEEIVKEINQNKTLGAHLKKEDFEKTFVDSLTNDKKSVEDKAQAIFEYVRDNFKWNDKFSIEANQSLKEIFKSKIGNSTELNLLTIALMRSAGVKANPILLATRNKGLQYMPTYDAFDNVIVGVEENGKISLYDPINKFSNKNILPIQDLNWIGRMINTNGSSKDILLEPNIESVQNVNVSLSLDLKNQTISGFMRRNYSNYEAFMFRNSYKNLANDKIADAISNKYKIQIDSISIKNFENIDQNIEQYIKFKRENSFDHIGDKIYISPAFIFTNNENPFKLDQRIHPIDFLYPNKNNYTITYDIPEGYEIDYLPKSQKIQIDSGGLSAQWIFSKSDHKFQVKWSLNYNSVFVEAKDYPNVKQFFEELVKFMDEKVVLKKI